LAEIDISKAYTGAFMRIRSIPVFNEFDTWQAYKPEEPIKNMSLYIVEAGSFDLFFNKRYNLCDGYFLKQLNNCPEIKAVKHPSIIKKVSYTSLVEELCRTPISDDPEEGWGRPGRWPKRAGPGGLLGPGPCGLLGIGRPTR
ncbi:MAG: hypothetical protein ACKPKO_06120, partial [Candidatus Fonsibacter sp.]